MYTQTFKDERHNRIIKFCTTVDNQSLIVITTYGKNNKKRVQLLTSYTDCDIDWLINEYKNNGILPLLISESIEQQAECNKL